MSKQPHLCASAEQIAKRVIVCGEPDRVNRIAALLDGVEIIAENREYRLMNGRFNDQLITICSTGIGAPSAIIALEELNLCGVKQVIRVGSSGALQVNIALGDLIVAEAAVRDDGGSKAYVSSAFPAYADRHLIAKIEAYLNRSLTMPNTEQHVGQVHYGVVRSHDSFYTDNEAQLCQHWHEKGVLGADMETSALLTVGKLRGMQVASILNNVVLFEQDVQEGVGHYVNAEAVMMNGEQRAALAALHALCND